MKIEEYHIPMIEKALGFELYEWQRNYLLDKPHSFSNSRGSGRTVTYCIKLALTDGLPLNLNRPEDYSDMRDLPNIHSYSRIHFKPEFLRIRRLLQEAGFKVVELVNAPKTSNVEWDQVLLYQNAYSEVVDYAKHLENYILRNALIIDEESLKSIRKQYIQPVTNIAKEWLGDE